MMVFNTTLSQAQALNDIMMRYVIGELSNPVTTFDAEETTRYLDVDLPYCPVTPLIIFASTDDNLSVDELLLIAELLSTKYDYVQVNNGIP